MTMTIKAIHKDGTQTVLRVPQRTYYDIRAYKDGVEHFYDSLLGCSRTLFKHRAGNSVLIAFRNANSDKVYLDGWELTRTPRKTFRKGDGL